LVEGYLRWGRGGVKMVYREGRGLEWCMGGEVV